MKYYAFQKGLLNEIKRANYAFAFIIFSFLFCAAYTQAIEIVPVDTVGSVGTHCILKVDRFGSPHILYNSYPASILKHARKQNDNWSISELEPNSTIDDFAIDDSLNLHASYAVGFALKYFFINNDIVNSEIIDASCLYSNSAIQLSDNMPQIVALQYLEPAYLIECQKADDIWTIDSVCALPIDPAHINFKVNGSIKSVAYTSTDVGIAFYTKWAENFIDIDTVYQDSMGGSISMDINSGGDPWILIGQDFQHNYNLITANFGDSGWDYNLISDQYRSVRYSIKYSTYENIPYVLFRTAEQPTNSLVLGHYSPDGWIFEEIVRGDVRDFSLDIGSDGIVHICFSLFINQEFKLFYGVKYLSSDIEEHDNIGVNDLEFNIFPNPSNGNSTLIIKGIPGIRQGRVLCSLFNILGQKISTKSLSMEKAQFQDDIYLNINDLFANIPSGAYFLSLTNGEIKSTQRIILIH